MWDTETCLLGSSQARCHTPAQVTDTCSQDSIAALGLPWLLAPFQEWTDTGWRSVGNPLEQDRIPQEKVPIAKDGSLWKEYMAFISCLGFYVQVTRITTHLAFEMRADMSIRAPEKVNLRTMCRSGRGGQKSWAGRPVRRPPLGFPYWSLPHSSDSFNISCRRRSFQTDSLKCRGYVLSLFVFPSMYTDEVHGASSA